jgi:hypothetical protein
MSAFPLLMFGFVLRFCPIELAAQELTTPSPSNPSQNDWNGGLVVEEHSTGESESDHHQRLVLDTGTVKPKLIKGKQGCSCQRVGAMVVKGCVEDVVAPVVGPANRAVWFSPDHWT